jgi:nitrogen fixation protein FixH
MNSSSYVSIRAIPEAHTGRHLLKTIAVFCAVVLGASLCLATYGLDLSAGFF